MAYLLVANWLRWGNAGEPGLCYYSDEAMADLVVQLLGLEKQDGLGRRADYYRKFRQRLGLQQAYHRKPFVTKARRVTNTGLIEIEFRERTHHHRLFHGQKMEIAGRQYYPIV